MRRNCTWNFILCHVLQLWNWNYWISPFSIFFFPTERGYMMNIPCYMNENKTKQSKHEYICLNQQWKFLACSRKPVHYLSRYSIDLKRPQGQLTLPYPSLFHLCVTQNKAVPLLWSNHNSHCGIGGLLRSRAYSRKRVGRWDLESFFLLQGLHEKSRSFSIYREMHGWIINSFWIQWFRLLQPTNLKNSCREDWYHIFHCAIQKNISSKKFVMILFTVNS